MEGRWEDSLEEWEWEWELLGKRFVHLFVNLFLIFHLANIKIQNIGRNRISHPYDARIKQFD